MENNTPLVSIVCDTYNHAPYVRDALDGFLAQQTNFPIEIIVHDDASIDGTAEAIRCWQERYPDKIHAILQTENQYSKGVSISAIMISKARGKYIAICEGDDYWTSPDKLEKQVLYMEMHPECSMCIHAASIIDSNGKKTGMLKQFRHDRVVDMRDILLLGGRLAATSSYLYPKALREESLPAFCRMVPGVGDSPLQLYLATKGTVYYMSESLSCYRRGHANSWTMRTFRSGEGALTAYLEASIRMLRAFDEYTNQRWHNDVHAAITAKEMVILQAKHEFSALFRPPYRKYFCSLKCKNQLKICAKFALYQLAPGFYQKLIARGKII